jgi:hypothetical protein
VTSVRPVLAGLLLPEALFAAAGGSPDLTALGQYGAIGLFALAGAWFAKKAYDRETSRADRLEAELLKLHGTIADKVIPALESSARAMTEMTHLTRDTDTDRRPKRAGDR